MRFFSPRTGLISRQLHLCFATWRVAPAMTSFGTYQRQQKSSMAAGTEADGDSQVARFYQNRVVFITGGTGFIGKVLLEKLLRSCPGLKRVYLLIRTKHGQMPEARMETILNSQALMLIAPDDILSYNKPSITGDWMYDSEYSNDCAVILTNVPFSAVAVKPVFKRLKREQLGALQKVKAVSGDLTLPGLGLSPSDQETLVEEVSVVFHSAATIKIDGPLKLAVSMNLFGTQRVLELCKKMSNLSALVHLSTAYCNSDKGTEVDEIIYQPCVSAEKVIEAAEMEIMAASHRKAVQEMYLECSCFATNDISESHGETFLRSCSNDNSRDVADELFGMPHTYALTKRLAESLLRDDRGTTPVAIVRPSLVTSSWREPFPGWTDSCGACTDVIISLGLGLLPSMIVKKEGIADFIPVDTVANLLICVAWHTATMRTEHMRVYHCTSGAFKRQTWADWTGTVQRAILQYPLPDAVRYPKFVVTSNQLLHSAILWCLHYMPACAGDVALKIMGQKPRFVLRYQKVRKQADVGRHVTTDGWLFRSNNVVGLIGDLSPSDTKIFSIDIQSIDWGAYWEQQMQGIRKYVFKAENDKLHDARRHLKRLYALHLSLKLLLLALLSRLLMTETAWELGHSAKTALAGLYETLLAL